MMNSRGLLIIVAMIGYASTGMAQAVDGGFEMPVLAPATEREKAEPEALVEAKVGGQVGAAYRDNIYRSKDNEQSDLILFAAPGFSVTSDTDRYAARFSGQVEGGTYVDESRNDYIDGDLQGQLRYVLTPNTTLIGDARVRHDHVEIGAFVDDPEQQADEPTQYNYAQAGAGIESFQGDQNEWLLSATTQARYYNYQNVDRVGTGRIINDDRDRAEWVNVGRAGYEVSPGFRPYGEASYNIREYDQRVDDTLMYTRNSNGYYVLGGFEFGQSTSALRTDIAAGYMNQDYDSDLLDGIDGYKLRGSVTYAARPWLTFHGELDRTIEETVLRGASGYLRTRVGGGVDYAFKPKWLAGTGLHYTNYDFKMNPVGNRPDREDDVIDVSAFVQYDINEVYNIGLEYLFVTRDSDQTNLDFDSNTILLRLAAAF